MQLKFAIVPHTPVVIPLERFLRYSGAGLVGTGMHFSVLFFALDYVDPVIASSLGAVLGCIINYWLAREFVFASVTSIDRSFPRFATVALLGIGLNALILSVLIESLPIFVCQVIASSAVLSFGYAANKRWSFNAYQIQ